MPNVEFYIENKLADFTDLSQLPLSMSKQTDKFLELVGVGGVEIEQIFKTMSFPMTNNNCEIFKADMLGSSAVRGNTQFAFQLFTDGNKQTSGLLRLKTILKRTDGSSHFVAEPTDTALGLWEKLETVSLNDLDLGTQVWNQTTIENSWTQNVDDINGIFAPIVYGALTSTTPKHFHARDFRFSVYDIPIMKAIFKKIGYTLESAFFDTEFMRNSVYCYSNGKNMQRTEVLDDYQVIVEIDKVQDSGGGSTYSTAVTKDLQTQFNASTRRFTPIAGAYFTINIICRANVSFRVNVSKNGVSSIYPVSTSEGSPKALKIELLLELGDYVEFNLQNNTVLEEITFEADIQIDMKGDVILGSSIKVSSCLHNKPVKEYLKGVTHRTCGAWYINEPLKKIYFEPRFRGQYNTGDGAIAETEYFNGFYSEQTQPLDIDISSIDIEMMKPFGNSLTIGYGEDNSDPIEKFLKKDSKNVPYDTKITFNNRNGTDNFNRNQYFTNLYMGYVQGIESSSLPCILPTSFTVGEILNGTFIDTDPSSVVTLEMQGEITFEGSPKCALIRRGGIGIYIDGVAKIAPLLTQHTDYNHGNRNYSMSYSNFISLGTGTEVRGLVSIFYMKYFAIIRQGVRVTASANVFLTDIIQTNFRKLETASIEGTPQQFICLTIKDLKLSDGQTATYELMQNTEANESDVEKTITVQTIAQIIPDKLP